MANKGTEQGTGAVTQNESHTENTGASAEESGDFYSYFDEINTPPASDNTGDEEKGIPDGATAEGNDDSVVDAGTGDDDSSGADEAGDTGDESDVGGGDESATETDESGAETDETGDGATDESTDASKDQGQSDIQQQLAAALDRINSLETQLNDQKKPKDEEQPSTAAPLYSEDEQAILDEYMKEWPDVAKGEALARRQELHALAKFILGEVGRTYSPLLKFMEDTTADTQYNQIVQLVPDYDDIRDKAIAWIDTQQGASQSYYRQIAQAGTAEEVAFLMNQYKNAVGIKTTNVQSDQNQQTTGKKTETKPDTASDKTKKVVRALKPVKTQQTSSTGAVDENDFYGAFDEFAAESK